MPETGVPISRVLRRLVLRRSQTKTEVWLLLAEASQVPFSEKERSWTGVEVPGGGGKVCMSWPVLTSKSLMEPSKAPVARRWPSGWKERLVSSLSRLVRFRVIDTLLIAYRSRCRSG